MNEILTTTAVVIIVVTISILYYLYKTRCSHKWKIISEQERMHKIKTVNDRTYENRYPCYLMQCEKCGKLFYTKDPDKTNGKIM
jgi:formylmethanofuran dehydrogenase subunit E